MKKQLLLIITFLFIPSWLFASAALYRISSYEVVRIQVDNEDFSRGYNLEHFAIKTDVTFPDGTNCRDSNLDLRVFGTSKILDGDIVRNATQAEIDTFEPTELDDYLKIDAAKAVELFKNDKRFRRIMIAIFDTLIEHEFNEYRTWFTTFQQEVAASVSLADFKIRMATLPAMPQRELSQLKTQVENRISKND